MKLGDELASIANKANVDKAVTGRAEAEKEYEKLVHVFRAAAREGKGGMTIDLYNEYIGKPLLNLLEENNIISQNVNWEKRTADVYWGM